MKTINPEIIFSKGYNPKTVFLTEYKDIEGRLDPLFYSGAIFGFLDNVKFPLMTIAEISDYIKTGFAVGREAQADGDEEKYIQIRPTNIGDDGTLKFDKNVYVGSEYLETKKDQILSIGDVLFNNTNSQELVGKTSFFDVEGIFFSSNHITRIKTKEQLILPEFLCWVLNYYQRNKVFFNICTNWNNQSGVGNELLRKIKIPIPPIEIQKKAIEKICISNQNRSNAKAQYSSKLRSIDNHILETLGITLLEEDNTIENRIFKVEYKNVANGKLDPYSNKIFFKKVRETFNKSLFPIVSLKDYSKKISSGATPLSGGDSYTTKDDGIPFIRSGEINEFNEIDYENCLYIKSEIHNTVLKSSQLKYHDVLIAIVGATIGQVAIYNDVKEANINQALALVRFKDNVIPEYFKSFLYSSAGIKILDQLKRPVARANINLDEIGTIIFPLPPINIQKEIVDFIKISRKDAQEILSNSNGEIDKSLNEIETLLKS